MRWSQAGSTGGVAAYVPPVIVPPTCISCGSCSFGDSSYMMVTVQESSCVGGNLVLTPVSEIWPFHSSGPTFVRWQKDVNNWIEFVCSENLWQFEATLLDYTGSPCFAFEGQPTFVVGGGSGTSPCSGFYAHRIVGPPERDEVVFEAVLANNTCIQTLPEGFG